jgi:hypothetical protein
MAVKVARTCRLTAFVVLCAGVGWTSTSAPVFKIYVEHGGIYEVGFDRLTEAGLEGPAPSAAIGLRNLGRPVPVWVEDGGDGVFGDGDRLLFAGEVLRGDYSYLDPHSRFNCYVLDLADPAPLHGRTEPAPPPGQAPTAELVAHHHLEADRVMVRFHSRPEAPEEEWYWERLSVTDREPFRQHVAVEGLSRRPATAATSLPSADVVADALRTTGFAPSDVIASVGAVFDRPPTASTPLRLVLGLRGWSRQQHAERVKLADHELEIAVDGRVVGVARWDGTDHHVHELEIPAEWLAQTDPELTLRVVKRSYPESGDLLVDVVLLNWIELEAPHVARVEDEQLRLRLAAADGERRVELEADEPGPVDLYLPDGPRLRGDGRVGAELPEGADEFFVLRTDAAASPDEIVLDRPSDLASPGRQADYIMITHRSLADGAKRLADFHRSRGLTVELVDVQDVYDEFNHGIVAPRAIRDFLESAYRSWRRPAPRFVLLIGDASWDFKNATADDRNYADWTYRPGESRRFSKNQSSAYTEGAELNHRNLVPTSSYLTLEGHAASDTWFACLDDGDMLPDLAIGRLPVVSPAELEQVIDKTIAFASAPPVGPWRRNLLFIANESEGFQRRSDKVADHYFRLGYVPTKIYPHPSEPANEHHSRRILEVMDGGVLAVHFIGHGGRYIWRTGPPDLAKNHDLFTLEHLDKLEPNPRLPVVLSLTCYSAPFDHPTADSIGEKLLRIADRGAIAVFAASWRNSPSPIMGESLLAELTTPGSTIGEAVMRAKRVFRNDVLIQTYNLLGDPAVPTAAPGRALDLELEPTGSGFSLRSRLPDELGSGSLIAEWLAADGTVLREDRVEVAGVDLELNLDNGGLDGENGLGGVRVYVWDEGRRVDGIGWAELVSDEEAGSTGSVVTDAGSDDHDQLIDREPRSEEEL